MNYSEFGDNSVLEYGDLPDPKVAPGEVLVKVRASSVNPVDWKIVSGGLAGMMDAFFPIIPGWDVAGEVVGVGVDTPEFKEGDAVMAYARKDAVNAGTMAEYVSVPVRTAAHKPEGMPFDEAGALPLAGLTAYQTLTRLGVKDGSVVLIHGASGGVGSFAVQIAKSLGATVIATASERNHEYLKGLGADHPVTYGDTLVDQVREIAPNGVDVSVDYVGGVEEQTLAVVKDGGAHGSIADPAVAENGGLYMWVRPNSEELAELGRLYENGQLRVEIAETFELPQLAEAFKLSQDGHTRGKIAIHVA